MMRYIRIYAVILSVVMALSLYGVFAMPPLFINRVSLSREVFNPSAGERIQVDYHLSRGAEVTIRIFDPDGYMIREVYKGIKSFAGMNSFTWDGRDERGEIVHNEAYYLPLRQRTGLMPLYMILLPFLVGRSYQSLIGR